MGAAFLRRYITVDETWIHHYTPETKKQSKQWVFAGERYSKKAYLRIFNGENYGNKIRIITTTTLFTGSKLEKITRWTTVHVERGNRPSRCLFLGFSEILLVGWLKKVGETLGKVYRVKRRLCWEILKNVHKIIFFLYLLLHRRVTILR